MKIAMHSTEFDIIKNRREGYKEGYLGCEYSPSAGYGSYTVSAKDAEQKFRQYCAEGEVPIFASSSDDTHAVPCPSDAIEACDYRELIDSGCKIGYVVLCCKRDTTEVKIRKSDKKLLVDYEEAVALAKEHGNVDLRFTRLIQICASSSDGQGITIEQEIFDLMCKVRECGLSKRVSLQTGECNNYMSIRVSGDIMDAYSKMKSKDEKKDFVQELQREVNAKIVARSKQDKNTGYNYLYASSGRLQEMVGGALKQSMKDSKVMTYDADERSSNGELETTARKKFADLSIGVKIGLGICICLSTAALGVGIKFGIDMVQHRNNINTIVFGVACGACILFGAVLFAMAIMKCKFSCPSKDLTDPDPIDISSQSADRTVS